LTVAEFIHNLPPWVIALAGMIVGAVLMRLMTYKDKTTIQNLSINIAVAQEKISHLQAAESDLRQYQQLLTTAKTKNAELQTRIAEQENNT
jgi:cell division protein FtsL